MVSLALLVDSNPRLRALARLLQGLYGSDPAHGWPHVVRVMRWAERIVEAEGLDVDLEVLALSVMLHDIGRLSSGGDHHAVESARVADYILELLGYDRGVREAVKHAILAHSYSLGYKAETLEAVVLSDADKLDALGAIGIARVFHTGALMGRSFEDSVNHFKEKILNLASRMYLEYSRRMAERLAERIARYLEWWLEENTEAYPPENSIKRY